MIERHRTLAQNPGPNISNNVDQLPDCEKTFHTHTDHLVQGLHVKGGGTGAMVQTAHLGQVHGRFGRIERKKRMRQAKQSQKSGVGCPCGEHAESDGRRAINVVWNERIGENINQMCGHHKCKVEDGDSERVKIRHCGKSRNKNVSGFHAGNRNA